MSFMVDTPYVTAYVRNEFLYDQEQRGITAVKQQGAGAGNSPPIFP
jgi:hypothetical protein